MFEREVQKCKANGSEFIPIEANEQELILTEDRLRDNAPFLIFHKFHKITHFWGKTSDYLLTIF